MGDHAFRAPAVTMSNDKLAMALILDIDDIGNGQKNGWRPWKSR